MAGFIYWIATRYDKLRERMKTSIPASRERAKSEAPHARTASIVADHFFGFSAFIEFAKQQGAITESQAARLREECWATLLVVGHEQCVHHVASEPPKQFIRLLASAISTARVHLAGIEDDRQPENPAVCGWRMELIGNNKEWRPRGPRIGWIDEKYVYLDPSAALAEAQKYAKEQDQSLPITERTLSRMLSESGVLAARSESRETFTVRKKIHGSRLPVLWILHETLGVGVDDLPDLPPDDESAVCVPPANQPYDPNLRTTCPWLDPPNTTQTAPMIAGGGSAGLVHNNGLAAEAAKNTEKNNGKSTGGRWGCSGAHTGADGEMEEYFFDETGP